MKIPDRTPPIPNGNTDEDMRKITDYLYYLFEQLRMLTAETKGDEE